MGLKTDGISQLGTERERVMIISTHPPMGKRCEWACKRVIICRMHHTHTIKAKKTTVPKRDMHIQNEQLGQNKEFNLMVTDAWMV